MPGRPVPQRTEAKDSEVNLSNSTLQKLFDEALRLSQPEERAGYLDRACGANGPLRPELDSLLRAHDQAGDFMAKTVQVPGSDLSVEPTGIMIGRYKLLEKIREGGFGVVYMAEQTEPVRRRVALKIIKLGMDTRQWGTFLKEILCRERMIH